MMTALDWFRTSERERERVSGHADRVASQMWARTVKPALLGRADVPERKVLPPALEMREVSKADSSWLILQVL